MGSDQSDTAQFQKKDANEKQRRRPHAQIHERRRLVMPVFARSLVVHGSVRSQNSAPARCWCVGDPSDRSNGTDQANSWW